MDKVPENGAGRDHNGHVNNTNRSPSNGDGAPPNEPTLSFASGKVASPSPTLNEELLAQYRVDQSHAGLELPKVRVVRVRRPSKSWFRVHPDADLETVYFVIEHERNLYLVSPALYPALQRSISERVLVVCVASSGEVFVWPLTLSGDWHTSGKQAALAAQSKWVCIFAAPESYEFIHAPEGNLQRTEPTFPPMSPAALVAEAFDGRCITSLAHEVARKCLGEEP